MSSDVITSRTSGSPAAVNDISVADAGAGGRASRRGAAQADTPRNSAQGTQPSPCNT